MFTAVPGEMGAPFIKEPSGSVAKKPSDTEWPKAVGRILRSLNRGWVTPDPTGFHPVDSRRIRSLHRGWETPDPPCTLESLDEALERHLRDALAVFVQDTKQAAHVEISSDAPEEICSDANEELSEPLEEELRKRKLLELREPQSPRVRPHTPHTLSSCATSGVFWTHPESVLILVDWDDTLFPTTWLYEKPKFKLWMREEIKAEDVLEPADQKTLSELEHAARACLLRASSLGRICCVTLAHRPWQSRTMQAFMPVLAKAWEKLSVEVRYAREERCDHYETLRPTLRGTFQDEWDTTENTVLQDHLLMRKKQQSMSHILRRFYQGGSWKNVVSFGDGQAELQALQEIGFQHQNPVGRAGSPKTFRVKTMKMLDHPDGQQLCAQLQIIQAWLPAIVKADDDMHVCLDCSEEELFRAHENMIHLMEM